MNSLIVSNNDKIKERQLSKGKKTIKILEEYYYNKKLIAIKNSNIISIKEDIIKIEGSIKRCKIIYDTDIKAVSYHKVQTSNSQVTSIVENKIVKALTKLENKLQYKKEQIIEMEIELQEIVSKNKSVNNVIKIFNPDDQRFLSLKYEKKLSGIQISNKISLSESQLSRKINKIIDDIAIIFEDLAMI